MNKFIFKKLKNFIFTGIFFKKLLIIKYYFSQHSTIKLINQ